MEEIIPLSVLIIIHYGVVQNFLLAVSILSQLRDKMDFKKALSFLLCLVSMMFFLLPPLMEYHRVPVTAAVCAPFIASIGPLYFIAMKCIIRGENRLYVHEALHFIPAAASALFIAISPLSGTIGGGMENAGGLMLLIATFHASAYFLSAALFLARQIPGKIAGDGIDSKIKTRIGLNLLHAMCIAAAGYGMIRNPFLYHACLASHVAIVLVNYIVSLRYPLKIDYYRNSKNRTFFARLLPNIDPEDLKNRLAGTLMRDNLFREEMTLPGLAAALGIRTYQLSHFINNYLETTFTDLINRYRVDEAKRMILSNPDATVLAAGYESGFNSKASFNRAFKKFTGMTPSDFRVRSK